MQKVEIKRIWTIIVFFLFVACGQKEMEFDSIKWYEDPYSFYPYRKNMVNDLMKNHLKEGMTYKQLTDLIGQPENIANLNSNSVAYSILEKHGLNIDPVETKTLIIELTKDSLVRNYKLEHWKK